MQLVVSNLLTSYSEIGKGKKVILFIHGWADSGRTFKSLAEQITKENKAYRAILLDLPGFGGTQTPTEVWNLKNYADFIKEFIKKAGIEPEIVVGHSNGGAVAIKGLSNNIFAAKKLVLIASAGIRQDSLKKKSLRVLSKPAKVIIGIAPKSKQEKIKKSFYNKIGSDYLIAENLKETFKNIVSEDVVEEAKKINIPVCLIYGQQDQATPVQYGEIFRDALRISSLDVLPEAGHFVHQEQVYKVATIFKNFIEDSNK